MPPKIVYYAGLSSLFYMFWRSLHEELPKDAFINEIPVEELAAKKRPYANFGPNDLRSAFQLSMPESYLIRDLYRQKVRENKHPLYINFAHLPIQTASRCADGKRPREAGEEKSCLVVKETGNYHDFFSNASWNPKNSETIGKWLRSIELRNPASLIVFADCDGTLWAQGSFDIVLRTAVETGLIPQEKVDELNDRFDRGESDQAFAYMNEDLFAGLTLNQLDQVFRRAKRAPDFSKVYGEMRRLVNILWEKGITVGYVTASPFFIAVPMLEEFGFTAPLWAIEGNDVFVVPPNDPAAKPVKLSNLVQSEGFTNWSETLEKIGGYQIVSREMDQIVSREGKGAAARSILERHALVWNRHQKVALSSQVRIAGVFGDNFAPFSDLEHSDPRESGNDQGMVRATPLMHHALILNIEETPGHQKVLNFWRFRDQLSQTSPRITFLSQKALRAEGRFVPNE